TESSSAGDGKVALVLGAGNVASIGPMDCLHKLFVEDEVVLLKTNPVNAYLGPYIEEAFAPLIRENVLCVVHGGAELGAHLTHHDSIDTIHITGSDKTHDSIVWGAPNEQASRKEEGRPNLQKDISSELGCVTPVLVVPGPWSNAELEYQAEHIAGMVSNNGSFNCNAAKVIVMAKDWELKEEFRRRFHRALSKVPARKAYYPGAHERYKAFMDAYPNAFPVSEAGAEIVPWTIIPEVPPQPGEFALTNEAFCGVVAEVNIDAADAPEFLEKAVPFANTSVWGNLSCMMLVHPETQKLHAALVEEAIANLRYGGIGINCWAGLIYGLCVTTWGAYPGNSLEDIRSGRGTVHNTYLFDYPEKSVVRAPFVIRPKPVWAAGHRKLPEVAKRLTEFEADPSLVKLSRIIGNAIQA
ncbi:MAG: aldehyde dehydrogenase family protein, partial [Myxococcota bacterium]|nr:aldehyde dehydrogenase family protein [Myxococcota bacterium]